MTATINASTSSGVVTTADNSGVLQLQTASTAALTIDGSQNVGIGTASPSKKLQVNSTDGTISVFKTTSGANNSVLNIDISDATATAGFSVGGNSTFPALTFANGGSERMRIDSSGNVGIGTSSPGYKLDVQGTTANQRISSTTGTNAAYQIFSNTGQNFYVGLDNSAGNQILSAAYGATLLGTGAYPMVFGTNNAERMRIDSSGNLLVGTTTNNGVITSYTSSASGRAGFFMVNAASSLAFDAVGISKFDNNTTTSQVFVKFFINNNTAASGLITASGANQAAFTSSSDSRLKENIVDLPSQLDNIMGLRPVEFDYIESEGGGHQIGFIAQEVKKIYPDLVGIREDGMFLVSDLNKNDARLIKAIQEQQALIQTLTDRITALEGK